MNRKSGIVWPEISVLERNLARERLRALWNEGRVLSLEDALELGLRS